jgi:hypothetical protein
LKAHDDVLEDELDQIRTEMGRKSGSAFNVRDLNKLSIDLPVTVDANFSSALRTYLVEQVTAPWNFWFGLLEGYAHHNGHSRVPQDFVTSEGIRLGVWLSKQRSNKDTMQLERRERLESLPKWTWYPHATQWQEGWEYLMAHIRKYETSRVPQEFTTEDGFRLGAWVTQQRQLLQSKEMSKDIVNRFEVLPGWTWNARTDKWDRGLGELTQYVSEYGSSNVPYGYVTKNGYNLGNWVVNQRADFALIPPERKKKLDELADWSWSPNSDMWKYGYTQLKEFVSEHGHANVIARYGTSEGFKLGVWVGSQRSNKKELAQERLDLLEALPGWSWDPFSDMWKKGFSYLKEYAEREGHIEVPQKFKTADGYPLGSWVNTQRRKIVSLSPEHKVLLEALPGWVWRIK